MRYNDYDDELERMRSRKSRTAGRRTAGERPVRETARQREQYRDEPEDFYEEDYEEGDWLDDDYDGAYDNEAYMDDEDGLEPISLEETPSGRPMRNGRPPRSAAPAQARRASRPQGNSRSQGNSRNPGARSGAAKKAAPRRRQAYEEEQEMTGSKRSPKTPKRRKRRIGKIIRNLILLALVFWLGSLAWAFVHKQTGTWTVAVFGVDSRDGSVEKNALADVQMICTVDRATGDIKLVSVYRDTYLKINSEGTYHKINEAYFKGGHKQAVKALEENLDLSIDNYATFNWKAVADAINILGGVDLEITGPEFEYINSFITETVESTGIGSHHLESAGLNHLDGVQAVAYCRLRLMDTDYQRTERQRKVISLALDKAKQADTKTLVNLVSAVLPQLSTDIGIDDVLPMAKNVSKYNIAQTGGFPFSRQAKRIGRMDCVIPTTLESNVIQLHQFLYGEENYKPSSKVRTISNKISEDSGLYEEGKPAPTGGSSSGGGSKQTEAPAQPAATEPVTEAPTEETTAEETVEETTQEETTAAETEPETTGEVGPGVTSTTEARETTADSGESEGPGGKPVVQPTKAPEKETSSFAPGDGPGGNGGGGTPGGSSAPGAGEAPGGSGTPGGNSGSGSLSGEDGPGGGPGSN